MRLAVLNIVGLSPGALEHLPRLRKLAGAEGRETASFAPAFPALTCTAQASMLTGLPPAEHGIPGNGWYDREECEVKFWKQSNRLVRGEKVWEKLRRQRPGFTCAKLFWWYNMYSTADWSITPRPLYCADGRKVFDVHSHPLAIREEIKKDLGDFPFPAFWGPKSGIASSKWIARSARWIEERHQPDLSLVYLPHLDYGLQKWGPGDDGKKEMRKEYKRLDKVAADLIGYYESRGVEALVVSEYGISEAARPVHLNRVFREIGWLQVKDELGRETLDCGACRAFAVADHQIAHVYVNDPAIRDEVRETLEGIPGVEKVIDGRAELGDRAGDWVAVAEQGAWFTYYYWPEGEDERAPDFARTIDIHRKPGYDPAELFIDPAVAFPSAKVASFLAKKKLGFRALLEVIPLDASLVRGSHGRTDVPESDRPLAIGKNASAIDRPEAVCHWIERFFDARLE